jgi:formylglycine-generating enzyme required for sulfatase activity
VLAAPLATPAQDASPDPGIRVATQAEIAAEAHAPLMIGNGTSAGSDVDVAHLASCATEMDAQEGKLLDQATKEWAAVEPLLSRNTVTTEKVVEAWTAKWGFGKAVATACGETRVVSPREAAEAQAWLRSYHEDRAWTGASPLVPEEWVSVPEEWVSVPEEWVSQNKAGVKWVRIPAGTFQMGSDNGGNNEKPVHTVKVAAFEMSATEVTLDQYWRCVHAGVCSPLHVVDGSCSLWNGTALEQGSLPASFQRRTDQPAVCVDWQQATDFATWAGGRLPSEGEWEYAAKAGQDYLYAGSSNPDTVAWYSGNSGGVTHPVGHKAANAWGLFDMSGNVWEWVQDWHHGTYEGAQEDGSAWTSGGGSDRVLRGGSWDGDPSYLRSSTRDRSIPGRSFDYLGFRVARTKTK